MAQSAPDDQVPLGFIQNANPHTERFASAGSGGVLGTHSYGSVLGVDSVVNWSSYFYRPGVVPSASGDYPQFTWPYTMVGNSPLSKDDDGGQRTTIGAPIVPVILDLRNADGSPRSVNGHRLILDPTPYITALLNSPIFSNSTYDSSLQPTQFTDAVQRAEFFNQATPAWHTTLKPRLATPRTMVLIRGTYSFALGSDGNLAYVLVDSGVFGAELFPPTPDDTTTVMGAAERSGDIHTKDISTFFFNNTYLYDTTPSNCCILGYHSYDLEPGDSSNGWRERRYVMDYASWISPGLFGSSFQDVTAVSHEMAETFNDPFVNNATPIWVAPNGLCQNNLETGDVIEGLTNATYPITLNGYTYHPQNEALLQWFAAQSPSNAIDQAYSYPDTTVLTSPSVSVLSDCATPFSSSKNTARTGLAILPR
jgi:hypothetical protein